MRDKKTFRQFSSEKNTNFIQAVSNIFMFLPYFFSVKIMLRSFFCPWRKLIVHKTTAGFSLHEWSSRVSFNLISRAMGMMMRSSIIFTFLIIQIVFVFFIPAAALFHLFLLPFWYLISLKQKTHAEKIDAQKQAFVQARTLKNENVPFVQAWFAIYKDLYLKKIKWWSMENLMSSPPLARDWNMGFTPTLDQFANELTVSKAHYKLLVGRQKEIAQIEQILSRSQERNVILCGDSGIGKHTIVEALAKRIFEGKSTSVMVYKRIMKLDMQALLGAFESYEQRERTLDQILFEASTAGNVILFIEYIDKYLSNEQGRTDFSAAFAKYAKLSAIQIISITTPFLYEKYIRVNEKIHMLFDKIDVFEISKQEAMQIMLTHVFQTEQHYKINILYETVNEIIERSEYYISDIPFPEKALNLLDEACSWAVQRKYVRLDPEHIQTIIAQKTRIPVVLSDSMRAKLLNMEKILNEEIIDQQEGIRELASIMRKSFVLAGKRTKPLASLLILGSTGVGKTQTAKTLHEMFFGSDENFIRVDMAFYQTQNDIEKLTGGSADGNPGILTQAVREKPYGVLLLDEFEKANPKLLDIFLTVLDEGYFIDGSGKRVDCKNLIIIATSNAAADYIYKELQKNPDIDPSAFARQLIDYVVANKIYTPELINRFDGVVMYKPISKTALAQIAELKIKKIIRELSLHHKLTLSVDPRYIKSMTEAGFNPQFGARNLERTIRQHLEDKITRLILEKKVAEGSSITIT